MGLINFLRHGTGLEGGKYDYRDERYYYLAKAQTPSETSSFKGIGTFLASDSQKSLYKIDNVVSLETPSNKVFEENKNFWTNKRTQCLYFSKGLKTAGLVTVGFTVCFMLAAGTILPTPLIAVGVFLYKAGSRVSKKVDEIEKQQRAWSTDPLKHYEARRRQVGVEGFDYVYKNDFKGTMVHADEMEKLWVNKADEFMKQFRVIPTNQLKEKMTLFFKENPLEQEYLHYTFDKIPSELLQLNKKYSELKEKFINLDNLVSEQEQDINWESLKKQNANEQKKEDELYPHKKVQQDGLVAADYYYKNGFYAYPQYNYSQQVNAINQQYEQNTAKIVQNFHTAEISRIQWEKQEKAQFRPKLEREIAQGIEKIVSEMLSAQSVPVETTPIIPSIYPNLF